MPNENIVAKFHAYGQNLVVRRARYTDGALALRIESPTGEPWGTISVNMPESASLSANEFCAKFWNENEAFREPALACGAFEDTGRRIQASPWVAAEVWRLLTP